MSNNKIEKITADPQKASIDLCWVIDVVNSNPNGDPDNGNSPRTLPDGRGFMTDSCLKRKIRNFVQGEYEGKEGFEIFVQRGAVLGKFVEDTRTSIIENDHKKNKAPKKVIGKKGDPDVDSRVISEALSRFFDVRAFGQLFTGNGEGKVAGGAVCGPVQFTFSESLEPIDVQEASVTRMAVASEKEAEGKDQTMGSKKFVPKATYVAWAHISSPIAQKAGFSKEDLGVLLQAMLKFSEYDQSSGRPHVCTERVLMFKHSSPLRSCSKLRVKALVDGSTLSKDLPAGVTVDLDIQE